MSNQHLGAEVARTYLERFPNTATLTLAKLAYRKNPSVWKDVEAARSCIRTIRGANGVAKRAALKSKEHFRPRQKPGNPFGNIPQGREQLSDWRSVNYAGPMRALVMSDVHAPYHDWTALTAALQYGLDRDANFILLNGDFLDFFAISKWEKDPRERDFKNELSVGKQILCEIRAMFPKARIVFKEGNHEERWVSYMTCKAPELLDIDDFQFENVLGLKMLDIDHVKDKRPIKLGKLNVVHGHEYRFAIANPVNPARGYFLRAKVSCLGGHLHVSSQHSEKNLEQKVVTCWSTGCLCELHPGYSPVNNWGHGFAFVDVTKDGAFEVDNPRIIDGKVYR